MIKLNKMKVNTILKGMLLWITTFAIIIFVSGVDSIYDNGYFIQSLVTIVILCYTCYKLISKEELKTLTLYKWSNNLIEKQLCEYRDNE